MRLVLNKLDSISFQNPQFEKNDEKEKHTNHVLEDDDEDALDLRLSLEELEIKSPPVQKPAVNTNKHRPTKDSVE